MKSEQRKKEDCELLDAYALAVKIKGLGTLQQFKQDNDLLPKNVSGWYLTSQRGFGNWISYLDYEKNIFYGINAALEWFKSETMEDFGLHGLIHPATQQQVEERLFPFFEKMYPKGAKVKCLEGYHEDKLANNKIHDEYKFILENKDVNRLWVDGLNFYSLCIMKDGILAELIEESEVDKLKAEIRKLSDKLKELGE